MWIVYFIQSESLCVLISKFNLLTFIEIIDIYYDEDDNAFKFPFFPHCFTFLFLSWFKQSIFKNLLFSK